MLISGEAGIGKTALIEAFLHSLPTRQRVLWGACDALFTPRPLGPLHDMASQAQGELSKLFLGELDRIAIFNACLTECQTPTIFIFEDIHWADEATLDLLKFLGRRILHSRSLLIASYRDDELGSRHPLRLLLGDLVRLPSTSRLVLPPLSIEAVRQLSGDHNLNTSRLHRLTGGNPFFVTEVLADEGVGTPASIPNTIRDVILARMARLSLSGRAVLNAAAVIGQRIEPWLLNEVTQAEAYTVDESLALGILVVQDDGLAFRHELVRQTILGEITPTTRIFLHQAILDALKASPKSQKDVTRLAHHAEAAGDRDAILKFVPLACDEALQAGMLRAESALWALMVQYGDDLPLLEQAELYEKYGLSLRAHPDKAAPIAAYRTALELARQAGAPELIVGRILVRLATMQVTNAQVNEAVQAVDEALGLLEALPPSLPLALAYKNRAYQLLIRGSFEASVEYAQKGYQLALDLNDIFTIMSTLDTLGLCWLPINHERGREYLQQTLALTLEHNGYWRAGSIYPNLSMTLVDIYQLDQAEHIIDDGLKFTYEHDNDLAYSTLQAWKGMLNLYQGEWNAAEKIITGLANDPGLPFLCQPAVYVARGRLLARRGESGVSDSLDIALETSLKMENIQRLGIVYIARAEAAWLSGEQERTLKEVEAFYDVAVENHQPGFAAELAYWAWKAGRVVEIYDWMLQPFILQIQGDWSGSAAAWKSLGCPYEQARALSEGDQDAQIEALAIFESLGARPMADKTRRKLRQAGVQTIPRGPVATTKENPYQLTNRQLEILALLTENLTNSEIATRLHISPKTVDHHVSAVLGKLAVSSREEAAELARTRPAFRRI